MNVMTVKITLIPGDQDGKEKLHQTGPLNGTIGSREKIDESQSEEWRVMASLCLKETEHHQERIMDFGITQSCLILNPLPGQDSASLRRKPQAIWSLCSPELLWELIEE